MIKQQIDQDIKKAMIAGDKDLVLILRGLKNSINYVEVAESKREDGLGDQEVIKVLKKESKKRQDAADLYQKAGDETREKAELKEKSIIDAYLPEGMSEADTLKLVEQAIAKLGSDPKDTGKIIGLAISSSGGLADGSLVAKLVKDKLQKG